MCQISQHILGGGYIRLAAHAEHGAASLTGKIAVGKPAAGEYALQLRLFRRVQNAGNGVLYRRYGGSHIFRPFHTTLNF